MRHSGCNRGFFLRFTLQYYLNFGNESSKLIKGNAEKVSSNSDVNIYMNSTVVTTNLDFFCLSLV